MLVMSAAANVGAQEYRYALFDLPSLTPDDAYSLAHNLNELGHAVGVAAVDTKRSHAAVWRDGEVIDLGTLGGDFSEGWDINESGDVVDWANFRPSGSIFVRRAFIWRDGIMADLGTIGGESSEAYALNNVGQITGESEYDPGTFARRAVLWEDGQAIVLPAPRKGRFGASASDINSLGHIAGAALGSETQATGTLWVDQVPIDLGSLSGRGSWAQAINDLGVIVGQSKAANEDGHAVAWINHQITDIHAPGLGAHSGAWDVNNHNQIVGWVGNTFFGRQAFIRDPGQPMRLLVDLSPPNLRENWTLQTAEGINDAGQIAAYGIVLGRPLDLHAFWLTPVSPTINLAAPQPGRAGEANRLRVTGCTPGARVTFVYSRHGGGERIPGCDLQQNALQLDSPTVIGTAIADANGVATITRTVPPIAQGQTILFQAVVQNECAISQLVVHRFE